jgi:hypothetical protein
MIMFTYGGQYGVAVAASWSENGNTLQALKWEILNEIWLYDTET